MQPNSCCMMTLGNITQEPCCQSNWAIHVHNLSCMMRWVAICSFPSLAVEINRTTNYHQTIRLRKHGRSLITPAFEWNNDCIILYKHVQIHDWRSYASNPQSVQCSQASNKSKCGTKSQQREQKPALLHHILLLSHSGASSKSSVDKNRERNATPAAVQQWWWSTSSTQS